MSEYYFIIVCVCSLKFDTYSKLIYVYSFCSFILLHHIGSMHSAQDKIKFTRKQEFKNNLDVITIKYCNLILN